MQTTETPTQSPRKAVDSYWEKFERWERTLAGTEPSWLASLRKGAISRFAETGFPSTKEEDWRFTNVAPISKLPFHPALQAATALPDRTVVEQAAFHAIAASKLTFVDGHYAPELSNVGTLPAGARILNLRAALKEVPDLLECYWTRSGRNGATAFTDLNNAFFTDGALIYLPDGAELSEPVHLLHVSTARQNGIMAHPRHLIVAGKNSRLTVIENYLTTGTAAHVTNVDTELVAGENARVEYCKFQDESLSGFHVGTIALELSAQANVVAHSFVLGAKLSRNNIRTTLAGEGIECVLNGLYLTKDDQLADHYMIVDHAQPHCNSHEYFNGILDGHSKGVFHGRILVRPDAQKTDAKQTNKNLLLSDDATADTKPQLEIYADDVKCTHGATVGQLNEESIFYLRARGIGLETARRMLMHAFAGEIIDRIRLEAARHELDRLVWDRLEQNRQIAIANEKRN